jgi:hypothetical protein
MGERVTTPLKFLERRGNGRRGCRALRARSLGRTSRRAWACAWLVRCTAARTRALHCRVGAGRVLARGDWLRARQGLLAWLLLDAGARRGGCRGRGRVLVRRGVAPAGWRGERSEGGGGRESGGRPGGSMEARGRSAGRHGCGGCREEGE